MPATNLDYWSTKIGRNQARDLETTTVLEERGWLVLRLWEHQPPTAVSERIAVQVLGRRSGSSV